ncbi:MAG: hypothetical protein PHX42_03140, partial [Candidatus Methanomethylophilaceae archaeon]|nr:hypothetical protein [Candidatus Methanomethylophilaceae archaeon]
MLSTDRRILVILFAMLTVLLMIGQGIAYWANPNSFDSDMDRTGDNVEYTLSSSAAVEYSITVFENGTDLEGIYVYYDEEVASYQPHSAQKKFIERLMLEFDRR